MANVDKIIGSLATAINKVSGSAISGLANIMGAVISLFSNTKSLSHGTANITDAVHAPTTDSSFQLIQTDAWSISFWIKVGWTNGLNSSTYQIASAGSGGVQDNMWRVYYNENNNRLTLGWRSANNERSNNFIYFHHTGAGEAALQSGLGTTYWSSSNPGYVNANGFTLITMTKGTGITAAASNWNAYWNGQNLGNAWTFAGAQGGNGVPTLLDEVSLWDTELSAAEVLEIWGGDGVLGETTGAPSNLQTSSMSSNLIGYWRFETDGTVSTVGSATLALSGSSASVTSPA